MAGLGAVCAMAFGRPEALGCTGDFSVSHEGRQYEAGKRRRTQGPGKKAFSLLVRSRKRIACSVGRGKVLSPPKDHLGDLFHALCYLGYGASSGRVLQLEFMSVSFFSFC